MAHDEQAGDPTELLDVESASEILEVPVEQVLALADQGVITPVKGTSGPRFTRAELIAARQLGG